MMARRRTANLGRLGALARNVPMQRPRNPRVVLLEHMRQMKRVLNDAVSMRYWGRPPQDIPADRLPENDPDEWAQVRRWAVWLEDAAIRLRHYAEQQERAAYKRRDAALASLEQEKGDTP